MKNKFTILLKTVEIPLKTIIKNGVNPCDRTEFQKLYAHHLCKPSTHVILDKVLELSNSQGIEFATHNCRWIDTIGEQTETKFRSTNGEDAIDLPISHYINYILKARQKLEIAHNERNSVKWYHFDRKSDIQKRIYEAEFMIGYCSKFRAADITFPSFKRQWFLDLYY